MTTHRIGLGAFCACAGVALLTPTANASWMPPEKVDVTYVVIKLVGS